VRMKLASAMGRRSVQKAGDIDESAPIVERGDIRTGRNRSTADRGQGPGKPYVAAMAVRLAPKREAMAGKPGMNAVDQGGNPIAAFRAHQRVDIASIDSPCGLDQRAATVRIGFVPDGQISLGDFPMLAHHRLLGCIAGCDGASISSASPCVDYLRGHGSRLFRCYLGAMTALASSSQVGDLLRQWRQRRRLSQFDLAGEAAISTRHLSFVETGRSMPSREMLLRLAEHLDMPLRVRNQMLTMAGFAAVYPERPLDAPEMNAARRAVEIVLAAHAPYPALAVDRHWTLVAGNAAVAPLLAGITAALLQPPVNVLRLSLHPDGLAPRIDNLGEWRTHVLARLQRQINQSADPGLIALQQELSRYPSRASSTRGHDLAGIAVPLRLRVEGMAEPLSLISTTTVFGTSIDVTLSELALECFFPADESTRRALEILSKR